MLPHLPRAALGLDEIILVPLARDVHDPKVKDLDEVYLPAELVVIEAPRADEPLVSEAPAWGEHPVEILGQKRARPGGGVGLDVFGGGPGRQGLRCPVFTAAAAGEREEQNGRGARHRW